MDFIRSRGIRILYEVVEGSDSNQFDDGGVSDFKTSKDPGQKNIVGFFLINREADAQYT